METVKIDEETSVKGVEAMMIEGTREIKKLAVIEIRTSRSRIQLRREGIGKVTFCINQAHYEQLEDEEDYRRDRPNDGRNENRTDGKRTRGGPHSKASGGRERVQHEHDYQSSHLTRNLNDRQ